MASLLFPFSFLFFFLFFFSVISSESSDVALLLGKIKPALQGPTSPENIELSSWNSSVPLCLWRGLRWAAGGGAALRCQDPAVRSNRSLANDSSLQLISIQLPASALSGSIPREIGELSSLQSLFLGVNSLTGPLPLELGNCPELTELDLGSNSLDGSLPPSIWNLCDRLVSLRLHGNALSSSVPESAVPNSTCDRLQVLDLGSNRFEGEFPQFITGFSKLEELDLSSNRFSGAIPNSLAGMTNLKKLNLSYNNFTGVLPEFVGKSNFGAEAFQGNNPSLCGSPLGKCQSGSGLSSGAIAGIVIGFMAGLVVLASVSIGWVQGRKRKNRGRRVDEDEMEMETEEGTNGGEEKLMVFQGGEHLTLEEVLDATGQVMEKTSYGTVYKAKLANGRTIALRLLREGSCKDPASCLPVIRQLSRARHENLIPLRAFYQGKRGEKLLIYDYLPNRTLHDLLHGKPIPIPNFNHSNLI